ncbi:MAG: ammonia-forming cytochrome c nitrite reductase subunit c552 [Haloferula sp.]
MKISSNKHSGKAIGYLLVFVATAVAVGLVTALLMNIFERKEEAKHAYVRHVEVTEDTTDPEVWGVNWPKQYESYKLTAEATRTRFGGHGGSEALPEQKIERDEWLRRMFLGYAFSIDYRDRRGHAYMLEDQEETERVKQVTQTGSCLHCHASVMPLYRKLGDGDAMAGFIESHKHTYDELNKELHDMGHAHPVSCVDCHDPDTMKLRVTRPGFIEGIRMLAESDAELPQMPSIERWRKGDRSKPYEPNEEASRTEMRSFVCGQCHVEYYCASAMPLEFPWSKGLKMEDLEAHWDETEFADGKRFYDYIHKESGAEILKAQHPEFELWSQGIHSRAGVACADCHMPYQRDGATKVSDHWVRSPLLNVNRACQTCHHVEEEEILARVDAIQDRNFNLLQSGGKALMELLDAVQEAKDAGATMEDLKPALEFQRKAQWRLDYIAAENSMGFHAPQEAARILGEAADLARQGQVAALRAKHGELPAEETEEETEEEAAEGDE